MEGEEEEGQEDTRARLGVPWSSILCGGPVEPQSLLILHNDPRPPSLPPSSNPAAEEGGREGGREVGVGMGLYVEDNFPQALDLLQRWCGSTASSLPFSSSRPSSPSSYSFQPSSVYDDEDEEEEEEGGREGGNVRRRRRAKAFLGFAGWEARQLEEEVKRGEWCVLELDAAITGELVFDLALDEEEEEEEEGREEGGGGEGEQLWEVLMGGGLEGREE